MSLRGAWRWACAFLKDKDGLGESLCADGLLHPLRGGQVHVGAEEGGEAVLEAAYGNEGQTACRAEVGEEIDVGLGTSRRALRSAGG